MNRLTSQQRKLVYLGAIVVLLIPIIWLGMPASGDASTTGEAPSGGTLARMRQRYDLGETTLGNVDPASATMNLVLLGLRGVATNVIWLEHDDFKQKKKWAEMRAAAESIIMLQPHYLQVWLYQGWDLSYNVSAEWDAVPDRYYWVKEGGKFTMKGAARNARYAELPFQAGRILGQKVGRSDEWNYFRKYFKQDPDPRFALSKDVKGPDPAFARDPAGNLKDDDNYLCAKEWFFQANEVELLPYGGQHMMARPLFRSYPARSQFDYADAMQREGQFNETTRAAWEEAFEDWTQKYRNGKTGFGQEVFLTEDGAIRLEANDEDVKALAAQDGVSEQRKREKIDQGRKLCNYNFWRTKALCERERMTVEAHSEIYDGQQRFKEGKHREAIALLESGMSKYAQVLSRYESLLDEDLSLEEGLMAVLYWQYSLRLLNLPVPEDFPLKPLWQTQQDRVPEIDRRFRSENQIQSN